MKKLIILDLNKNYVLQRDNCNYLNINRGLIKFHNAVKIEFNLNKNPKLFGVGNRLIKKCKSLESDTNNKNLNFVSYDDML